MINFILYSNPTVTLACLPVGAPAVYSLKTAAHLGGVHPEVLRHYCQIGLFGEERADPMSEPVFDDDALFELRRIEHYRVHHRVSRKTLRDLCDLWREVERLQDEVRFLRRP